MSVACLPTHGEIGNNIRKIRILKGYKQEALAMQLGISKVALSKIENGKTDISLSRLCSIAQALRVDIKTFFTDPMGKI